MRIVFTIFLALLPFLHTNAQTFSIDTISDAVFQRMWGKSYKKDCTLPRSELRYLRITHYDGSGKIKTGEIVCNKRISNDLLEIFQELYNNKYPIERVQMIDDFQADDNLSMEANNTSCFNYRTIAGTQKLSNHSLGMAIDINPLYNPYVRKRKDGKLIVQPEKGRKYANRELPTIYRINKDDLCYKLFLRHGFRWGGSWMNSKDYQHFEK